MRNTKTERTEYIDSQLCHKQTSVWFILLISIRQLTVPMLQYLVDSAIGFGHGV